jgi:hypothetical protein
VSENIMEVSSDAGAFFGRRRSSLIIASLFDFCEQEFRAFLAEAIASQ